MREISRTGLAQTCKRWARAHGWWVHKFRSPGHNASPDDVFAKNGVVLWVEFKRPGKRPTEMQQKVINEMLAAGLDVVWVDNIEDFKAVLTVREAAR